MKNKIIYPCKIPCEMYIHIVIAERLSVTEIVVTCSCSLNYDLLFCRHLCIAKGVFSFSLRSICQHGFAYRNFWSFYIAVWKFVPCDEFECFPQKFNILTKSKWVKKERDKTVGWNKNQDNQKHKEKCLCAPWIGKKKQQHFISLNKIIKHDYTF